MMPKYLFIKSIKFLTPVLILTMLSATESFLAKSVNRQDKQRPNIIFILTDDLGYGDLGCYGQKVIQTPNLDRLAAEGLRFTDAYTPAPVCGPARCGLMTGKHMGHAYIRNNSSPPDVPLRPQDLTIAELLQSAGYRTGLVGKWGLGGPGSTGGPTRKGFDYSFGFLEHSEGNYFPRLLWRNEKKVKIPPRTYQQDIFTDEALQFIEREKSTPFFLYLAYMVPHSPYEIPSTEPYSAQPWQEDDKRFAAMITHLDRDVGNILARLRELGIEENTVIFFGSDNGPETQTIFNSVGSLNGIKRTLYEGGIRVPFIAYWKGTINPQVNSTPVAFYDFLPTACELAGLNPPSQIDGVSLLPILKGEAFVPHRFLYWEFKLKNDKGFMQAVRLGSWKGIMIKDNRKRPKKSFELYDLSNDPAEVRELSSAYPEIVSQLKTLMKAEHREDEAPLTLSPDEHEGHH
jgi:arylsulfatase A-like enzyme